MMLWGIPMNTTVVVALIGAIVSLASAIFAAVQKFSINKATATKISTDSTQVEANTAEIFSRLSADWTMRADARVLTLEKTVLRLVEAIDHLVIAVDNVAPILEVAVQRPHASVDDLENVVALSAAARMARRAAL